MLSSHALILNRSFLPVHITSVRRGLTMLYQGLAKAVDEQYQTFDFMSWASLSVDFHHERVGIINGLIRVPRVLLLQTFDRLPKRQVRFSRYNIYLRDQDTCQYCGKKFSKSELNLDHVVPRSRGGMTTWENVVCSCIDCNRKKGGNLPEEAGMHLLRKPAKPHWFPLIDRMTHSSMPKEWHPYLNVIDFSYWNLELKP